MNCSEKWWGIGVWTDFDACWEDVSCRIWLVKHGWLHYMSKWCPVDKMKALSSVSIILFKSFYLIEHRSCVSYQLICVPQWHAWGMRAAAISYCPINKPSSKSVIFSLSVSLSGMKSGCWDNVSDWIIFDPGWWVSFMSNSKRYNDHQACHQLSFWADLK